MNGYNFTERVRRVLAAAREEAVALSHEYVGTEHMLLGLLRERDGVAHAVLDKLDVDGDKLRDLILFTVKKGQSSPGERRDLPYTSRSKKVLELAMAEARTLEHSYVGTEHLLLGLIAEGKGVAAQVLTDAGAMLETVRGEVIRVLGVEPKREFSKSRARVPDKHAPGSPRRVGQIISAANEIAVQRMAPRLEPAHVVMALVQ
ncbi:MAG TPA: Clp protease N-terminal domain-containing protein, partial [Gemmatimonadaceae bacterium]